MRLQVESLRNILSSEALRSLAIETGFSKRSSKLTPEVFFDLVFYSTSLSQNSSLEYLVSYLESQYGILMHRQSLNERFSEKSENFVKRVLSLLISEQFSDILYSEAFLSKFEHVRIKDSTKFNVPSNLASYYKGSGGSGSISQAGISIQYEFDLKTGKFLCLNLTEAIRNDQRDAKETVSMVCKNDLVIRDLGYFSIPVLKEIEEKEAFYLSRLHSAVSVYDENEVEIDFKALYVFMTKNGIEKCEKKVFIGQDKVAVRLLIELVPPQVYQQRVRRKEEEERRRGRQMKEKTRFLLRFHLFITNVEAKELPQEKVLPLYRFRWQIELMFKNWKSIYSIHMLRKMKKNRYITMLYVRLILIIVNLQIINKVQSMLHRQENGERILSYNKTLRTLKNRFSEILNMLRCEMENAIENLEEIYRILSSHHWREKRKKRENFVENISLFACIS